MRQRVGIVLFDDVEVMDFAGPFEVFAVTGQREGIGNFDVYTIGSTPEPVRARNNLSVNVDYTFGAYPTPDILVVPGGFGTRREMHNQVFLDFIRKNADVPHILSICSGALLLAKAGMLDGLQATTHRGAIEELRKLSPKTEVLENARFVDNGQIVLSAGISAGIDAALYMVGNLCGVEQAEETARYMEYDWREKRPGLALAA